MDFKQMDLRGTRFQEADLRHSTFSGSNLTAAQFSAANLEGCVFAGATLEEADFSKAVATGTNFARTTLRRCSFEQTDFTDAQLQESVFDHCNLSQANLAKANLSGATFIGCQLTGTVLAGADLSRTTFLDTPATPAAVPATPIHLQAVPAQEQPSPASPLPDQPVSDQEPIPETVVIRTNFPIGFETNRQPEPSPANPGQAPLTVRLTEGELAELRQPADAETQESFMVAFFTPLIQENKALIIQSIKDAKYPPEFRAKINNGLDAFQKKFGLEKDAAKTIWTEEFNRMIQPLRKECRTVAA